MSEPFRILSTALVSGSVASIFSAGALALLANNEGKAAVRPINATSHWWHGDRAGSVRELDLPHTGLGYATHHASCVLWALLFETLRARSARTDLASIARDAAVVSATATVLDYGVMPRRLTPGWELALTQRSVAGGLAALAAGLTLGGLITRRWASTKATNPGAPRKENDMPTNPTPAGKEPAEGSRETIEKELSDASKKERAAQTTPRPLAGGDDAASGTAGTGEDVCPKCRGTGKLGAKSCSNCNGSGRVIKGIGGA